MGARNPTAFSTTIANAIVGAGETVVCVTPPISPIYDSTPVMLWFWANLVAGASTTNVQVRIYRGTSTAGVRLNVNVLGITTVAGNTVQPGGCYFDVPGSVAQQQYCFTLTCSNASGGSTLNDVAMLAIIL